MRMKNLYNCSTDVIFNRCRMLKSKSLEISPGEEKHKSKAQDLEDEKKKLKEFEKAMNKSKISRKDSDSDSMNSPKSEFIRTNSSASTSSDQPGSPKTRASKRMSVIDLKALKKAERDKLSISMPADDSKVQTQKQPATSTPEIHVTDNTDHCVALRKRSTSANTALPVPAFSVRNSRSKVLSKLFLI